MSAYASEILIRHHLIPLPSCQENPEKDGCAMATILTNISYYGYALSEAAYQNFTQISLETLTKWWQDIEPILRKLTGDDKNMDKFVVYKNFPQEVLDMSETEYWTKQILMYWGFDNEYFTEEVKERPKLHDKISFKVLQPAQENSLLNNFNSILYLPNRWVEQQWQDIRYLLNDFLFLVNTDKITFKENLIQVLIYGLENDKQIKVNSATDVLRLAVGLSEGDISLRQPSKFRTFKRRERRYLLNLLNQCSNLTEDIFRRANTWKKLMFALHPGDYAKRFPEVIKAYNCLYNNQSPETFNAELERLLAAQDSQVLDLLKQRSGEFYRRLHQCLLRFGQDTVIAFKSVIPKLKLIQLLKIQRYLETVNYRLYRTIPPQGNWTKLQILAVDNSRELDEEMIKEILNAIAEEIKTRVNQFAPIINLDPQTDRIKLQTNDSELTPYGRGTIFPIPNNVTFIRTASYWRTGATNYNIWYDNGWNFFTEDWTPLGSCCWTHVTFGNGSAIFSGDPTNSKDLEGNACQLIDLYLPELLAQNVRYGVWNILCFNHVSFNKAQEVYAALQWGENSQTGNLFDPSRCQLSFPIKGDNLTKYIALIDFYKNHLIYLDANLYGRVNSANDNLQTLSEKLPAFMEYLDTLPSVFDLFKHQNTGLSILYSDQNFTLKNNEEAYVFRPENKDNQFTPFPLTQILGL
ncbi:MAG: hypothetical protein AB4041_18625 [Microcystaceae cyanobacterium]